MARIRREIENEPTPIMRWGDMTEAIKPLAPEYEEDLPVVTDQNDSNFLSEVADIIKDAWLCPCGYQNNGIVCTKCGATHNEQPGT